MVVHRLFFRRVRSFCVSSLICTALSVILMWSRERGGGYVSYLTYYELMYYRSLCAAAIPTPDNNTTLTARHVQLVRDILSECIGSVASWSVILSQSAEWQERQAANEARNGGYWAGLACCYLDGFDYAHDLQSRLSERAKELCLGVECSTVHV